MTGAAHSHDPEYPEDSWNLYSMLDPALCTTLNATRPGDTIGIMRPFARRLEPAPILVSDADAEMIVSLQFTSPVHVRKIMVIGGGEEREQHPSMLRCYVNEQNVDFASVESLRPAQEFTLPINEDGTVELTTSLLAFSNVTTLHLFFPSNHGARPATAIRYIGMQGEHTHYRREAVDTVYEVLCNGQDICQPEEHVGKASSSGV